MAVRNPFPSTGAAGAWGRLSLAQQLGNAGSEVSRALKWKNRDPRLFEGAMIRARELLCDAWLGGKERRAGLEGLDRYFFHFAVAARK